MLAIFVTFVQLVFWMFCWVACSRHSDCKDGRKRSGQENSEGVGWGVRAKEPPSLPPSPSLPPYFFPAALHYLNACKWLSAEIIIRLFVKYPWLLSFLWIISGNLHAQWYNAACFELTFVWPHQMCFFLTERTCQIHHLDQLLFDQGWRQHLKII